MKYSFVQILEKFVTSISAGSPASPVVGQIWYDSVLDKFRGKKASVVVDLEAGSGGGGGSILGGSFSIDFLPVWSSTAKVVVVDPNISPSSKILLSSPIIQNGRSFDEFEFEQVSAIALPGTGEMTVIGVSKGLVWGGYDFNYIIL